MSAIPPVDNPVTASLLSRLEDKPLHTFVASWDSLEQLAVVAYRDQQHDLARETLYRKLRGGLLDAYPRWEGPLRLALEALSSPGPVGEPDPFSRILGASSLAVLQADWDLMRCFPQAREAINVYLLERLALEDQDGA